MADSKHNLKGNCVDRLAFYGCVVCSAMPCDVCHEHDEPRGQCSECPPCETCDEIQAKGASDGR